MPDSAVRSAGVRFVEVAGRDAMARAERVVVLQEASSSGRGQGPEALRQVQDVPYVAAQRCSTHFRVWPAL